MRRRQQLLVIGFAGFAALVAVRYGWNRFIAGPLADLDKSVKAAEKKAQGAQTAVVAARHVQNELAEVEPLSLPRDPTLAQEAYQAYLIGLLQSAKVADPTITPGQPGGREGVTLIPFTVKGEADMASVVRLLAGFYATPRLQRINQLSLNPIDRDDIGRAIRFSLSLEALAWGDTARGNPDGRSAPIAKAPAPAPAEIDAGPFAVIVERNNLLARGPGEGALEGNSPEYVILASIVDAGREAQADLYDRAVNTTRPLRVGELVSVGGAEAKVIDLGIRDVVLEAKDGWWLWELGTSYSARRPLSPAEALEREIERSQRNKGER